jgi:hypothetical protein
MLILVQKNSIFIVVENEQYFVVKMSLYPSFFLKTKKVIEDAALCECRVTAFLSAPHRY